jgi:hypothetical protein
MLSPDVVRLRHIRDAAALAVELVRDRTRDACRSWARRHPRSPKRHGSAFRGSFHLVEGKRLQVNSSAVRYQRKLTYLKSVI